MPSTAGKKNLHYFYLLHPGSWHNFQENTVMQYTLDAIQSAQHTLAHLLCACFIQHTLGINVCVTGTSFLVNSFPEFPYSMGKKILRFHPVIGGISLQQHLLFFPLCSEDWIWSGANNQWFILLSTMEELLGMRTYLNMQHMYIKMLLSIVAKMKSVYRICLIH